MLTFAAWSTAHSEVFAAGLSDDDSGGLGLIFLLSGFAFYAVIYFRYRNVDKRHRHESETEATMLNMQEQDEFVQSKKGLRNSKLTGANNNEVRGARRKFF